MTKIVFAYSKTPRSSEDENGTSIFFQSTDELSTDNDNLKFKIFNTVDTMYAKIWLEQWNKTRWDENVRRIDYNVYETITDEQLSECQHLMLDTLNEINSNYSQYQVPADLFIRIDKTDKQWDTLNRIHEYYEDTSAANDPKDHDLYVLLERVNFLVHRMEGAGIPREHAARLTVVRSVGSQQHYTLKDDDYEHFEEIRPGYLYVDYATVGKDFYTCYLSDDVSIIRDKKVSPQLYITPSISYYESNVSMMSDEEYSQRKQDMRLDAIKWLEDNNLTDVDNVDLPNRAYGRLRLATPEKTTTWDEFTEEILSTHPYFYGVYIIE